VQLPNFSDYTYLPSESNIAVLRNNQCKILAMPNTAMVVTTDCGEWNDIHPLNKKDIGCRLALAAQGIVYNEDIVYSGPLFESVKVEDDKIILTFNHTGSGLITNDGEPLRYFALAGTDKKFVWADAVIEDNKVIVWSGDIKVPKYIRYNWADNPEGNLYNKEGLPASPFHAEINSSK
jgi:sialate O-acetylesterase